MQEAARSEGRLRLGVLGPLSLEVDGASVDVPGTKRRAVLALLAVGAPEPVATDRLVDAIWPDDPPSSGRAALQSHISRLRRHLGPLGDRLTRRASGYCLRLEADELDWTIFASLVDRGRRLAGPDPKAACVALNGAIARWRGAPLSELVDIEPVSAWARATTEERLAASDLLASCALRVGDTEGAARAATEALNIDPLREATVLQLMRALAAQGRNAEALRAGHELRTRMREQTGLDPSPALTQLERELAAESPPATDVPPPAPALTGDLLGREAEIAGVGRLLASERLVTIVGPGGVGKTRLAIEFAHRSRVSVAVVELAPVTDAGAVAEVLAGALGVEAGAGDPLTRCMYVLQQRRHLLLLDNCEHLLEEVRRLVTSLLASCSELSILATSRERLGVAGEATTVLAPLPMPGERDAERVEAVPSVALFLDRARRARPAFTADAAHVATVARIVRALDGLPLAIELAAGRVSSLGLTDLEARLDRALDLLGGSAIDAHGRHRTLRAAVEWSYDLLGPDEQRLFRHLAAFPGGFDLATAEGIARSLGLGEDPATLLSRLVDCSMVMAADLDAAPRYRMLDTLRSFGIDRLVATGENEDAQAALLHWAATLTSAIDAAYETEDEPEADRWLRDELANLRGAWRLARDTGDLDVAAALAVDLYGHAVWSDLHELLGWSLELAADPELGGHKCEAQVLGTAAEAAWKAFGDLELAEQLARRGVAVSWDGDQRGRAVAAWALADVHLFLGQYEQAAELAISARDGTRFAAEGYAHAAMAAAYAGDMDRARVMAREAWARVSGPTLRSYLRYIDGELANLGGDFATAKAAYREAIAMAKVVSASFIAGIASVGLVSAQAADGDVGDALVGYQDLIHQWERMGAWTQQWTTLRNLASLLDQTGDEASAAALRIAADRAPEAPSVAGAARKPLEDPDEAADNRQTALLLANDAISSALGRISAQI